MFIKKIIIENFKWYSWKQEIEFNYPSWGNNWLNFFIWENNTWKSTIFEAVNFIFSWIASWVNLNDLKNKQKLDKEIIIEIEIVWDLLNKLWAKYEKYIQKLEDDIELIKIWRSSKVYNINQWWKNLVEMNIKKLWVWNSESNQYENPTWFDSAFKQFFDIDFIWADTSPEEITKFWSTTIVWKLISRISEWFKDSQQYKDFEIKYNEVFNDEENGLKSKLKEIESITEWIFKEQFWEAKIHFHFDNLDVSSYFKNTRIKIDDGTKTFLDEKWSWMQRAVALTLLQVYVNLLPEREENRKPFYLFIDEPEICLHPKAQIKLIKALNKLSESQQIFLTTHSPYIFKETWWKLKKVNIFTKEREVIKIKNTAENFWLFWKYSPSWWEINYYAYNLPTVEFHNELYWYLEANKKNDLENLAKTKKYLDDRKLKGWETEWQINWLKVNKSLQEYIRHLIHHPENNHNEEYTNEELEKSINDMINLLETK